MRRHSILAATLGLAATSMTRLASAQPVAMPPPPAAVDDSVGPKSPVVAAVLSAVCTGVPIGVGIGMLASNDGGTLIGGAVLIGTGAVFGPSVGHWYAGEGARGALSMVGRLGAFGTTAGGIMGALIFALDFDSSGQDAGTEVAAGTFLGFAGASAAVGLGLMLWDLIDAPSAAQRANREARRKAERRPRVDLGPTGGTLTWQF